MLYGNITRNIIILSTEDLIMCTSILQLVSLYNIDYNLKKVVPRSIEVEDAKQYISDLSNRMITYKNIREYLPKSLTSEVISKILELINNFHAYQQAAATSTNKGSLSIQPIYNTIATKLLTEQLIAQTKYKQITEIHKGSLIQSLLESDDEYIYILALVEHNRFIDDNDLKYKIGMPDSEKVALKSARLHLTKNGTIKKIFLSDSHPKISEYWYDGFLDLYEAKDDAKNTENAYNALADALKNSLSYKYKPDYAELKNSLNVYFSHQISFTHDECINFLLDSYVPVSPDLNIDELKGKLIKTSSKYDFDSIFCIDIKNIESKLKNRKYKVNDNIELRIKKPVQQLKSNIYTFELETGEKVLCINNVDKDILEKFNFNNIQLE